jgi:two-component system response regulator FixJ
MDAAFHTRAHQRSMPRTVFIVDGDEGVRSALRSLLETLNVHIETYGTAEELLGRMAGATPDCLITEVHLPRMSGTELQKTLRERGIDVPVIVLATHADVPIAVRAMLLGALDFIEKPFVGHVVLARVKQALDR